MAQNLTRGVPAAMMTAISQAAFFPIILVHLDWPAAAVRVHSNVGTLTFEGLSWLGVGAFGAITLPEESRGQASLSAELRLVGLGAELDDYLDDEIRGRQARIFFGAVTQRAGNVLVADPVEVFSGYMDALRDVTQGADGVIERGVILTVAQGPSQRSAAAAYHTAEDQARQYPTDTAGRHTINAEARAGNFIW